jgi:hypothetical protein
MSTTENKPILNKRLAKILLINVGVLGALAAAMLYQSRHYIAAAKEVNSRFAAIQEANELLLRDITRVGSCRSSNNGETQIDRGCLVRAAYDVKSPAAVHFLSIEVGLYLIRYPDDIDVRDAGLTAVAAARKQLLNDKVAYLDAVEDLAATIERSLVVKYTSGKRLKTGEFSRAADILDQAELRVVAPHIKDEQSRWRLAAHAMSASLK